MMKKYKVIKPILLTILTPQDSYDFTPINDTVLECDGSTIWVWAKGAKWETITTANAIDFWLEQGKIIEYVETIKKS